MNALGACLEVVGNTAGKGCFWMLFNNLLLHYLFLYSLIFIKKKLICVKLNTLSTLTNVCINLWQCVNVTINKPLHLCSVWISLLSISFLKASNTVSFHASVISSLEWFTQSFWPLWSLAAAIAGLYYWKIHVNFLYWSGILRFHYLDRRGENVSASTSLTVSNTSGARVRWGGERGTGETYWLQGAVKIRARQPVRVYVCVHTA